MHLEFDQENIGYVAHMSPQELGRILWALESRMIETQSEGVRARTEKLHHSIESELERLRKGTGE